jgi:hypothetical protein
MSSGEQIVNCHSSPKKDLSSGRPLFSLAEEFLLTKDATFGNMAPWLDGKRLCGITTIEGIA